MDEMENRTLDDIQMQVRNLERIIGTAGNEIRKISESLLALRNRSALNHTREVSTSSTYKRPHEDEPDDTELEPVKKLCVPFNYDEDGYVEVYTDGACENNGKKGARAGLGVWFGPNHPLNVAKPVSGRATNNVGEIQACTCAIKIAHSYGVKKLCINTDSQFVINSITKWILKWKKNNWTLTDGGPVKNKEDFVKLDAACNLLQVKWKHVRGHCGNAGNEGADYLARQGAEQYKA